RRLLLDTRQRLSGPARAVRGLRPGLPHLLARPAAARARHGDVPAASLWPPGARRARRLFAGRRGDAAAAEEAAGNTGRAAAGDAARREPVLLRARGAAARRLRNDDRRGDRAGEED